MGADVCDTNVVVVLVGDGLAAGDEQSGATPPDVLDRRRLDAIPAVLDGCNGADTPLLRQSLLARYPEGWPKRTVCADTANK